MYLRIHAVVAYGLSSSKHRTRVTHTVASLPQCMCYNKYNVKMSYIRGRVAYRLTPTLILCRLFRARRLSAIRLSYTRIRRLRPCTS